MSVLHVHLFGRLQMQFGDGTPVDLCAQKAQELFCYLLLHRDRAHPREALANLLWGNSTTAQSKKYLRQALWQLQSALHPSNEPTDATVLAIEPDWVQLNRVALWLDVAEFERAFSLVSGKPGQEICDDDASALRTVVQLYHGDLLEGWCQDWCLYERERLQNVYLAMLDKLIGYCEVHRNYELGLLYGTQILRHDRARERTHRQMMRLYHLAGDRTAALRQYERCRTALKEELEVKPSKATELLRHEIRQDRLGSSTSSQAKASPAPTPDALVELLEHLEQVQAAMSHTQDWLRREIQAVKMALTGQS